MNIKIVSKPVLIGAATAIAAAGMSGYVWHLEHRPKVLEIYVFPLKTGQAIFIRTPEDKRILIDGGSNSEIISKITSIIPFYSRRIDMIIATRADARVVSGLIDVLGRYQVGAVYVPGFTVETLGLATSSDPAYTTFLSTVQRMGLTVRELKSDTVISFGTHVSVQVLFPAQPQDFQYSKASSPELFMRLSYGATALVFLGGASTKVQKYIAAQGIEPSDVLVVSHSAISSNMDPLIMSKIDPDFLVYSKTISHVNQVPQKISKVKTISNKKSSKNSRTLVDSLASILPENRFNIREKGTIKVVSDGKEIRVE